MSLVFKEDFWHEPALKEQFLDLTTGIHNLNLARWGELGYWDDAYRPFSVFLGDQMISNVCVYSLDMMVAGQARRVAQISAVATRPVFRRQGLNSRPHRPPKPIRRRAPDSYATIAALIRPWASMAISKIIARSRRRNCLTVFGDFSQPGGMTIN